MARRRSTASPLVQEVSDLVRAGYGALLTFDTPGAWVELAGPNGAKGAEDDRWRAPVTTLRLVREGAPGVVVTASRDAAFAKMLGELAEQARPFAGDDHPVLLALLRAIRDASAKPRSRMPTVGSGLVEHGETSLAAWLSCLTLADLEEAMAESCEESQAA